MKKVLLNMLVTLKIRKEEISYVQLQKMISLLKIWELFLKMCYNGYDIIGGYKYDEDNGW